MSPTFADLGVPNDVLALLAQRGITTPTPIQAAAMADGIAGLDVCGKAPTGSGKTLAFGIPMVLRTERARPRQPRALVLVPTRELAAQVSTELNALAQVRGRRVVALYGGVGYEPQMKIIRRGVDIIVATPGRLEDMIDRRAFSLSEVDVVVIDEADRMADMGFLPPVKRILDATSETRQTMLFSATLDGEVDALIKRYQKLPRRHVLADPTDGAVVEHFFWATQRDKRVGLVADLVNRHDGAIVFCRTRHGAERLAKQLGQAGIGAAAIHGDRTQAQREKALQLFKAGKVQALVATDVAARGIHVDAVPCVVHFDPAADHKDYLHRSGRTGRAGMTGVVVTLVSNEVRSAVKVLQRGLGVAQRLEEPGLTPVADTGPVAPRPAAPTYPAESDRPMPRADRPTRMTPRAAPSRAAAPSRSSRPSATGRPTAKPRVDRSPSAPRRDHDPRTPHGSAHPVPKKPAKKARWTPARKAEAKAKRIGAPSVRRDGRAPQAGRGATPQQRGPRDRRQ